MYTILISHSDDEIMQSLRTLCGGMEHIHILESESTPAYCRISTAKGIYNIPHKDILFVESVQKKSVIHTATGSVVLPIPLYRVRSTLPETYFIQTHRSFLINLKNASFIDKTKEPWTISFFHSTKTAFVSRSFRKEVMQAVSPLLDCISD